MDGEGLLCAAGLRERILTVYPCETSSLAREVPTSPVPPVITTEDIYFGCKVAVKNPSGRAGGKQTTKNKRFLQPASVRFLTVQETIEGTDFPMIILIGLYFILAVEVFHVVHGII
jgi:hypothetical protein